MATTYPARGVLPEDHPLCLGMMGTRGTDASNFAGKNCDVILALGCRLSERTLHDFGGFTDGDRCLFFAVEMGAELIVLAGMDFGKVVTRYSRPDIGSDEGAADEIKELKLKYAKKLVEWAAENEDVEVVTISGGEEVKGVLRVDFRDIKKEKFKEIS